MGGSKETSEGWRGEGKKFGGSVNKLSVILFQGGKDDIHCLAEFGLEQVSPATQPPHSLHTKPNH